MYWGRRGMKWGQPFAQVASQAGGTVGWLGDVLAVDGLPLTETVSASNVTIGFDESADVAITGDWDFSGGTLRLPQGTTDPTSGMQEGDIFWDTDDDELNVYNGSSWTAIAGGGGSVAGSDTEIQFNSSGSHGASSSLTWSSGTLSVSGTIALTGNQTLTTAAQAGAPGLGGSLISSSSVQFDDTNTLASGTAAAHAFIGIGIPDLTATNINVTTTDAANLYIAGAPTAGTNQAITNSWSLWIDSGNLRLDGTSTTQGADSLANAMQVGDGTNAVRIAAVGGIATLYGGAGAIKYLRIGDAGTTSHPLASEDDLMVTGKLEVDGASYFDALVESSAGVRVASGSYYYIGAGSQMTLGWQTVPAVDWGVLSVDTTNNTLAILNNANRSDDYGSANQSNPTVKIYSATAAATATDQWISLAHDQTDGVITTGKGAIKGVSGAADGASAIAYILDTTNTLATSGALHSVWRNATTDLMTLDKDGIQTETITLDNATGNQVAHAINYTVNKATSGNDTGLVINQTDTLSPGTSLLLDAQVGGASKCTISQSGQVNATADGLATLVKAGTLSDADFTDDTDGLLGIDSSNGRIYFRYGAAWHYVNQTAGFEINAKDIHCTICGESMEVGHAVIGILDAQKSDGAMHGEYAHAHCAMKDAA